MPDTELKKPRWPILAIVTITVGVASGLGGMALGLLLRVVQHVAFGYSERCPWNRHLPSEGLR